MTYVICKCVACGKKRKVFANEIPKGEQPLCDVDLMPMLAESAEADLSDGRESVGNSRY
jgi:hypothetical protein